MNHAMDELVRLSSDSCAAVACFLCQRHQFSNSTDWFKEHLQSTSVNYVFYHQT